MLLTGCTGLEEGIKLPFTEHFVPGTVLSTLKITLAFKNCSTFKTRVFNKFYCCPHFTDEKTSSKRPAEKN